MVIMKQDVSHMKPICFIKNTKGGNKMSEIKVQNEKDIFNPNVKSFNEREAELVQLQAKEEELKKRQRNSPFKNFLQVNKETYKLEDKLMKKNPLAYRIWRFLANNMDHYNAVMVSYNVLMEIFDVSRTTIYRAIKVLEDGEYIKIYKSGTSNIYAINDNMVWNSWGTNKKYSKFNANIIIGESEQSQKIKKEIKIKTEKHKQIKLAQPKQGDANENK